MFIADLGVFLVVTFGCLILLGPLQDDFIDIVVSLFVLLFADNFVIRR